MQFLKSPHFARRGGTLHQVATGPPEESRSSCCHRELREKVSLLEQATDDTLLVMARMVEQKDPYTVGHQLRVSCLPTGIALEMDQSPERCDLLRRVALIHDIGKIGIPSDLLTKPTVLTPLEMAPIRTHAETGYQMVKDISFFTPPAEIIRQYRERMDGSDYLCGLKADEILSEARVLVVVDVPEAMTLHQPYHSVPGTEAALAGLSCRSLYDAAPVDALTILIWEKDYRIPVGRTGDRKVRSGTLLLSSSTSRNRALKA